MAGPGAGSGLEPQQLLPSEMDAILSRIDTDAIFARRLAAAPLATLREEKERLAPGFTLSLYELKNLIYMQGSTPEEVDEELRWRMAASGPAPTRAQLKNPAGGTW
jgi:hypothetical protein